MRELVIELPYYEGRDADLNTLEAIASKHDLEYDAMSAPIMTVSDAETKVILLESRALVRAYISGDEDKINSFLDELRSWFTEF